MFQCLHNGSWLFLQLIYAALSFCDIYTSTCFSTSFFTCDLVFSLQPRRQRLCQLMLWCSKRPLVSGLERTSPTSGHPAANIIVQSAIWPWPLSQRLDSTWTVRSTRSPWLVERWAKLDSRRRHLHLKCRHHRSLVTLPWIRRRRSGDDITLYRAITYTWYYGNKLPAYINVWYLLIQYTLVYISKFNCLFFCYFCYVVHWACSMRTRSCVNNVRPTSLL